MAGIIVGAAMTPDIDIVLLPTMEDTESVEVLERGVSYPDELCPCLRVRCSSLMNPMNRFLKTHFPTLTR